MSQALSYGLLRWIQVLALTPNIKFFPSKDDNHG
jgi:hypothetical protein